MPRADQATIDLLTDYFHAMEVKDFDRLGAYYADDITQTFANAPTITGRDTMLARMVDLLGKVEVAGASADQRLAGRRRRGDLRGHQHLALPRRHRGEDQRLLDLHHRRREVHRPTHLRRQRPRRPLPRLDNTTTPTRQKARSCPASSSPAPPRARPQRRHLLAR